MPIVENEKRNTIIVSKSVNNDLSCYHCGTPCLTKNIAVDDKYFCCEGCKLVYEILDENGLCDYYKIQSHPGLTKISPVRKDKFAYLDNKEIAAKLYKFTDGSHSIVTFYLPNVHCSSCMWLLEHLSRVNPGILESRLNFTTKEVTIHFTEGKITIRELVELLAMIGYEPFISLNDGSKSGARKLNRSKIYKLGVAGFCFGNIMMMSFPEYLSFSTGIEAKYAFLFRYFNLILSLPVFFYSASEFFETAWAGLKQKALNIDAPIALAIIITFGRSLYEILTKTGAGYLDSMSGIVFFMLVGRVVQDRTYKSISFHRDYKSYFPIAVTVLTPEGEVSRSLQDLKEKDIVRLHNDEIIPADSILISGKASIDYSFVTGESDPVHIVPGQQLYAGGRQVGEQINIQVVKPVAGSYLTSLWNHYAFDRDKEQANDEKSVVHVLSRYFTWILFALTGIAAGYWALHDPTKIINVVSAMLIVACPCALLLCVTFTNGNLLRIFSNNGLFLRDATVIEQLSNIDTLVFDKTGTLTQGVNHVVCAGHTMDEREKNLLYNVVFSSKHPYSQALKNWLGERKTIQLYGWREMPGQGLEARTDEDHILVGSRSFVGITNNNPAGLNSEAAVYVKINENVSEILLQSEFRESIPQIIPVLKQNFNLSVLSGDNDRQKALLTDLFGTGSDLLFDQKPIDKLKHIEALQKQGRKVLMIGDGLNDAGALQISDVGITLADDINNFTPSCDAILDASRFDKFPALLRLGKVSRSLINFSFIVSIIYNCVGLVFSAQGLLRPVNAAILMPCSTLSIVIISTGLGSLVAKKLGLSLKLPE